MVLDVLETGDAYAGGDLAGVSRLQYPPNMRPIRVMCSGAVDSVYILRALLEGAPLGTAIRSALERDAARREMRRAILAEWHAASRDLGQVRRQHGLGFTLL